jgi:hypothetical protein
MCEKRGRGRGGGGYEDKAYLTERERGGKEEEKKKQELHA